MNRNFYLIILTALFFISCQKKENITESKKMRNFPIDSFKNYSFKLLTTDYKFDMSNRIFTIDFYKFSDTIELSKVEEDKIAKVFFENYIDTLQSHNFVRDAEIPMIMPNFGDSFYIDKNGINKSFLRIEDGKYKNINKMKMYEKNILNFRNNVLKVLKNNGDFKKCLDTLKSVKKYDNRIFM